MVMFSRYHYHHGFLFSSSYIIIVIRFINLLTFTQSLPQNHLLLPNQCGDKCGSFDSIPFPFHLNVSCGRSSFSDAFRLSCSNNSSSLSLNIGSLSYQVLQFFPDGILVDFPNGSGSGSGTTSATSCRDYNDLKSFGFEGNDYFGISRDNVVGLYDCEDSSVCKGDCSTESNAVVRHPAAAAGCEYPATAAACCYPLSDRSSWPHDGDGFPFFSQFGCRGFTCWVVVSDTRDANASAITRRGVKLEWAIPSKNLTSTKAAATCATNAHSISATSIISGMRCQCLDGFVGDGFAQGVGCLKSCLKDEKEAYGRDCYTKGHSRRKLELLAGGLTSVLSIASLTALFCLLKRPTKSGRFDPDQANGQCTIPVWKASNTTRLFTYHELEEATNRFEDDQKLSNGFKCTLHPGILGDGLQVAVHKVQCENERDRVQVLSLVEILSSVPHRNMACLLGCSIDSSNSPLIVYEYPANGTLEQHLRKREEQNMGLDWYNRLNIASQTASVLAFLQCEISPPIFHHDLQSGCILLDLDFSVKIAGFGLPTGCGDGSHYSSENKFEDSHNFYRSSDVYNLGLVLLEIIAGARPMDPPTIALEKIRSGKLEQIVDPILNYHEQPAIRREQIDIFADLATRCLLFGGGDGKLGMTDVARELVHIAAKETTVDIIGGSRRTPALEETFSNSSLLQMISMSPDSMYVP